MPTNCQRWGHKHKTHGALAGWAWNLVSFKKKEKEKKKKQVRVGETEQRVTESVEISRMKIKQAICVSDQGRSQEQAYDQALDQKGTLAQWNGT